MISIVNCLMYEMLTIKLTEKRREEKRREERSTNVKQASLAHSF